MVVVASAAIALLLQSRSDARTRSEATVTRRGRCHRFEPAVEQAVTAGRTSAALQQQARLTRERSDSGLRRRDGVPRGIRYTHPNAAQIGRHYIGSITRRSGAVSSPETTTTGTLGPLQRTVVPVTGPRRQGRRAGVRGHHRRPCEWGRRTAGADRPRGHRAGARGGHRWNRAHRQASEPPDARARTGADDAYVRASRRRSALGARRCPHRRSARLSAPGQRRSAAPARASGT